MTAGVPVELAPGGFVVTVPELGVVPLGWVVVVSGCVVVLGWVVVVPGWVVLAPGLWV